MESSEESLLVMLPSSKTSTRRNKNVAGFRTAQRIVLFLVLALLVATSLITSHHLERWLSFDDDDDPRASPDSTNGILTKREGPSILETVASWMALGRPFDQCGQGNHTSVKDTVAQFTASSKFWMHSGFNDDNSPFGKMSLAFQAFDFQGLQRRSGGDEFVVTLWMWTRGTTTTPGGNPITYKQAVVAQDLGTGAYQVTLIVPRFGVERIQLSLMHYYTCYQGLGPHKPGEPFLDHPVGPYTIAHVQLEDFLRKQPPLANTTTTAWEYFDSPQHSYCETSQRGLDDFTQQGLWVENQPEASIGRDVTLEAKWKSVVCQPRNAFPAKKHPNLDVLIVGDSTMPYRQLEVGDPFHHYFEFSSKFNHHQRWVDYLSEGLRKQQQQQHANADHKKVLVFSGGLHQLYQLDPYGMEEDASFRVVRGYNVPTAVQLVTRMLCQLALVHPDRKLMVVGVGPVQQQKYKLVDNTDQNVLWFNALFRQFLVETHGGRLADICASVDLSNLFSIPDELGNAQDPSIARRAFEKFGYQVTPQEELLIQTLLAEVAQMETSPAFDKRFVAYADIHDILLARPECFKDKLHDSKAIDYHGKHSLGLTHHHVVMDTFARMRADMQML